MSFNKPSLIVALSLISNVGLLYCNRLPAAPAFRYTPSELLRTQLSLAKFVTSTTPPNIIIVLRTASNDDANISHFAVISASRAIQGKGEFSLLIVPLDLVECIDATNETQH